MDDKADDVISSFGLSEDDQKKYSLVKDKFDGYFVKFNLHKQLQDKTVDGFVTNLFCLTKDCSYRELHDEIMRDRLVVGLLNAFLLEKM